MHQLKYNNRPEAGFRMGQLYAQALKNSGEWNIPDLIIPVPLHPAKLRKRQYNQSECIANGLASVLLIPVISDNLVRVENTETQTKKTRFERYENLASVFVCRHPGAFTDKHVLIVDDVITTGATLEACSMVLQEFGDVKISIAAIAFSE